jgi:hypothetical protein
MPKEAHMDRTTRRIAADILARTVEHGGGTFEGATLLPFEPKVGYAVGIGGVAVPVQTLDIEMVAWVARAVASEYMTSHVGTWLNNGTVFIDAVRYFEAGPAGLARATQVARDAGQLAFYDFGNQKDITL